VQREPVVCRSEQAGGQDARMVALLLAVSVTFVAATLPRCAALIATEFIGPSTKHRHPPARPLRGETNLGHRRRCCPRAPRDRVWLLASMSAVRPR